MNEMHLFWIGKALGCAESAAHNDCFYALAQGPRELFERVEGYYLCPKAQTRRRLRMVIEAWLREQGYDLEETPYDVMAKYGPSPWTGDMQ